MEKRGSEPQEEDEDEQGDETVTKGHQDEGEAGQQQSYEEERVDVLPISKSTEQ